MKTHQSPTAGGTAMAEAPGRAIEVTLGVIEGGYAIQIECDDECTQRIVLNGANRLPMPDSRHLDEDLLVRATVLEHFDRCQACRSWMGADASVRFRGAEGEEKAVP